MKGLLGGPPRECAGCRTKDQIIEDLRRQLDETLKTLLVTIDAKAYAIRHAGEKPTPAVPPFKMGPVTPEEFRATIHQPAMSPAEIEATFEAQERVGGV